MCGDELLVEATALWLLFLFFYCDQKSSCLTHLCPCEAVSSLCVDRVFLVLSFPTLPSGSFELFVPLCPN